MKVTKYATHLIIKTSESIKKKANSLLKPYNLTVEQYAVLQRIYEGFDTSSKILSAWGGTKPSLANKLSELEKKGLIERNVAPKDKRIWIFSLKNKGLKLFKAIQPIHEEIVSKLYQKLSVQEIKKLTRILEKINK
jgi:DNA-binding MarR family transcriptional regulator